MIVTGFLALALAAPAVSSQNVSTVRARQVEATPVTVQHQGRTVRTVQRRLVDSATPADVAPVITENLIGTDPNNRRLQGSLLLFPEFDNRAGVETLVTVSNVSSILDVRVHYVYIARYLEIFGGGNMNAIVNGFFDENLDNWVEEEQGATGAPGDVQWMAPGRAVFFENTSFLTTLRQSFVMPEGASELRFDFTNLPGFEQTDLFIPDAFEASLLDDAMNPVVPAFAPFADSFFNIQEDRMVNLGPGTTIDPTGLVTVDVSGVAPGTQVTLFFDFIGGDTDTGGGVSVDNVELLFGTEEIDAGCLEWDLYADLTPLDTLTTSAKIQNPDPHRGFLYAYAVDEQNRPISKNLLIGHVLHLDGMNQVCTTSNAVSFCSPLGVGVLTDVDMDGHRDLNGTEYAKVADKILIPRFFGQDPIQSELILLGLSGGTRFETLLSFTIYNDNEQPFSRQYAFRCWDRVKLEDISSIFKNENLLATSGQNMDETLGRGIEYGWFEIDGNIANSDFHSIIDPAFYAVLVEGVRGTKTSNLPFEIGLQNGHLLPRTNGGDNEE